ncbi:uncharacterized protein F5Z01DRAFT_491330 [Emericellopsis atlantica]|uniref:Secreted protein n=1 Tax=Emericellopsis atlantica TaxID=2614577 RepID=A0A9P7ZR95_9HYPO|nr:uncharacterized protein F5Z01DRAFT_491330 [Emericellopsis atlantica]KAG9256864.1 hypothetical protein F5Z01DRAFT_491330 [Emericellopsis atlantica]
MPLPSLLHVAWRTWTLRWSADLSVISPTFAAPPNKDRDCNNKVLHICPRGPSALRPGVQLASVATLRDPGGK